jgi:hypothetical protein
MAAANYIDFTSGTKLNGLVLQTVSSLRSASNTLAQAAPFTQQILSRVG